MGRNVAAAMAVLAMAASAVSAGAAPLPDRFLASEAKAVGGDQEMVKGTAEAVLITPPVAVAAHDPRDNALFGAAVFAYVDDNGSEVLRFRVHAPDATGLPLARRVARYMSLLWGGANGRFHTLCARLRKEPLDVWLTRAGEGGEHFKNNIYLYNVYGERSGLEWGRQLAHEYGHYLLPGASGYAEPENWSNGVLGERLFIKWLSDDVAAGRLDMQNVPFLKPADIELYCKRQVQPLLNWMAASGPDPELLRQTTRRAMDAYTGLILYIDATYGSASLFDMLEYLPAGGAAAARAEEFAKAFAQWTQHADAFSTQLGASGGYVYLPVGTFRIQVPEGGAAVSVAAAKVASGAQGWTVKVTSAGWRTVSCGAAGKWKWQVER